VIAAWPSFALTTSWELLTRQIRISASTGDSREPNEVGGGQSLAAGLTVRNVVAGPRSGLLTL
jgi:hypothetical protein